MRDVSQQIFSPGLLMPLRPSLLEDDAWDSSYSMESILGSSDRLCVILFNWISINSFSSSSTACSMEKATVGAEDVVPSSVLLNSAGIQSIKLSMSLLFLEFSFNNFE